MKNLLLFISLFCSTFSFSQDISHWEGHYSGMLEAVNSNGKTMSYHMEFIIEPIDENSYTWTIIYGKDSTRQERNYIIKRTATANHFLVDEQNSIVLNMDLIDNIFYSVFEVEGNLLHVQYQWTKKGIIFILTSSAEKSATGNGTHEGEKIPIVHSWKTSTTQYAFLKRVKD